jgi:hypothetical protein
VNEQPNSAGRTTMESLRSSIGQSLGLKVVDVGFAVAHRGGAGLQLIMTIRAALEKPPAENALEGFSAGPATNSPSTSTTAR